MSFGNSLKQVLRICHIKLSTISPVLGYDPSYISKWLTGTKLPSEYAIESVCDKIAGFCCKNSSDKCLETLCVFLSIPANTSGDGIRFAISDVLQKAYQSDKSPSETLKTADKAMASNLFCQQEQNRSVVLDLFAKANKNISGGSLDIIISACSFLAMISPKNDLVLGMDPTVHYNYHIFYDPVFFDTAIDYCRFICCACSLPENTAVSLYEVKLSNPQVARSYCLIRNSGMLLTATTPFSDVFPTVVSNVNIVNTQYASALSFLAHYEVESHAVGELEYERYLYKSVYTDLELRYRLFTQMMCSDEKALSDQEIRSACTLANIDIGRLQSQFKRENSSSFNCYYYESTIIDFCQTGKWRLSCDYPDYITLTINQRRKLLKAIHDSIDDAANHCTYQILRDYNPILPQKNCDVSFSHNKGMTCVIRPSSSIITYIKSEYGVSSFNSLFHGIANLPEQYLLSREESREFLANAINSLVI